MIAAPATDVNRTVPGKGRIGLVVFGSITAGLVLGLVLVLVVFAGGEESQITGSALLALGSVSCCSGPPRAASPISRSDGRLRRRCVGRPRADDTAPFARQSRP